MLDQLIHVIVVSFPQSRSLVENIIYIKQFHFTNLHASVIGYNLASFHAAIQYILISPPTEVEFADLGCES